jgi:transposase-like protein
MAVRDYLCDVLEEELTSALGAPASARVEGRSGYRHGSKGRRMTTSVGSVPLVVPRARMFLGAGGTREWESRVLPRYERRTPDVDAAVLSCYLGGVNTRKVKAALRPLLGGAPLSKSAVSRIVARLQERCAEWSRRSLKDESIVYILLDGLGVKVRIGKRVVSVPVLAAVGVRADGQKVLLALELAGAESTESWKALLQGLDARGLKAPILAIVDGNPGLLAALAEVWPRTEVQRCTVHKLRNLLAKAPLYLHDEIHADYDRFVYAETEAEVRAEYERFLRKWEKKAPKVAASLREAGEDLLTFTRFPAEQWKCLRTTNAIERLNEEFRRRVKTQCLLPSEEAVVVLLYALVAEGFVKMRKIDGFEKIGEALLARGRRAA